MNRKELFAWGKQCPTPFVQALVVAIGEIDNSMDAVITVIEVAAAKMREQHKAGVFGYQPHLTEATRSYERLSAKQDTMFSQLEGLYDAHKEDEEGQL